MEVRVSNEDAEVLYAGAAPGLVDGVVQINVRLPRDISTGSAIPISIKIGNAMSQAGITVSIK